MKVIALIDGGGTKTRVRFINQADQTAISEVVTGPSNLGLGADVCWEQIMQAITLAGVPMPVRCVAGLAGSEYAKQRSAFLSNSPCETLLVSDRDSGLFGAHCGMPGGCLTVGTGVAFAWLDESRQLFRRGGYGFMLADQGGGAWIGLRFLQELVRLVDRGLIDQSHQVLIDRLGIGQSVIQWMEFANAAQPRQFASLAKAIVEAEGQVSLSADIVSEGLMALIDLIEDFPKHLPIALVGGLSPVYSPRIQSLGYHVVESQGDALDGLAYIDQHRPQLTIDYWESYA
jgi:glucosamine kinase